MKSGHSIHHLKVDELDDPAPLLSTVRATGATAVYVHIDMDVLDPTLFPAVGSPEPGSLSEDALLGLLRALTGEFFLAGLGITEYERPDHLAEDDDVLVGIIEGMVESVSASPAADY